MQDRIPRYAGRVILTPVPGQLNTFDLIRADDPTRQGTPLNAQNLLSDTASATVLTLAGVEPTNPSEAFIQLSKVLYPLKKNAVGILSGSWVGTGYSYAEKHTVGGAEVYGSLEAPLFNVETAFTPLAIIITEPSRSKGAGIYTFVSPIEQIKEPGSQHFAGVTLSWQEYGLSASHTTYKDPENEGAGEHNCGLNDAGKTYNYIVVGIVPDTGTIPEDKIDWEAAVLALIDSTLSKGGHAADAKAAGDARAELRARILQTASAVTPLLLTADAIDDNPGTVLMPDGSTAATASAIGASDAYACRPGQTLAYTLSTQAGRLVLAVYDAAGNLTHGVAGGGYGAYITGEYTFAADDAYFRVGGVTGGNYRKNYALSYSYGLPNAATRADLAAVEAEMEALRGYALPTYWETYLQEKAGQIREAVRAVGNHGVVFQFFTDFHRPQSDVNYRSYTTLPQLLAYVKKHCFVDDVIFGGDVLQKNATAEEAAAVLEQYAQEFAELKPLNIVGNHDGNRYGGDPAGSAPVGADTLYSILFRGMEGRVRMGPGLYWYRDNDAQKVRLIALNTGMDTAGEWNADTAQHRWLVDTLAGTPEGYTLIVIPHVFFKLSGGALALSAIGSSVKAIVDAYASRSSGTWQGVSYDFTHAGGTVACILCGHTHNDGMIMSDAGYPMIGTVCEAMWGSQQTVTRGTQAKQTTNEHAFDVVCLDTGSKTVQCVRVGSGADRTFSYS